MTDPSDDDIMDTVDQFIKVAREKALDEARKAHPPGKAGKSPTDEQAEKIETGVEAVKTRFKELLTPHPDDFDTMIETMRTVESVFGTHAAAEDLGAGPKALGGSEDLAMLDTAKSLLQNWDGELKNGLVDNYLAPMYPAMTCTQGNLARFLRQSGELMRKVYVRRRTDAKKVAEDSITAIEAIDDCKGGDFTAVLRAVLGTPVGDLASVMSGGAALTSTLTSTAAGMGSAMDGEFIQGDKELPLGGDTVEAVVYNMYDVLNESDKTMKDEETAIIKAIRAIEELTYPMVLGSKAGKGNELVPPRPGIVNASQSEVADGLTVYGD
ncbi:MAG: hypothetical protein ACRD0P_17115 [Stackebrandtia sp.]